MSILPDPLPSAKTVVTVCPSLSASHLAELRASGLTDDTIRAAGHYTETVHGIIAKMLGWKSYKGQYGDALVFPFFSASGNRLNDYQRLKFSKPRTKDGKLVKYESPLSKPNRPYFPPGIATILADGSQPIYVTEGEKKALKATQEGIPTIGLVGVDSWAQKRTRDPDGKAVGERKLLPDLAAINWQGRRVFVVFDSDARHNPNVRRAECAFAETLAGKGALVLIVRLPDGTPDADGLPKKNGLDDFLLANSVDDFLRLVDQAEPAKPLEQEVTAKEAVDDPDRLARLYLLTRCAAEGGERTLRYWRESWMRWDGTVYRDTANGEIDGDVHRVVKVEFDRANCELVANWDGEGEPPNAIKITRGLITNVLDAIRSMVIVPATIETPIWLDAAAGKSKNVLAMENGLLSLDALFDHKPEVLIPHSANWFSRTKFPYPFDPSATCPKWLAFLNRNLEGDAGRIAIVQEWFGLNLIHDTSFHKFFVMEGEGANGKSVICAALEGLLGNENCAFVPLEIFGQRFQLTPTVGRLANIVAECSELDKVSEGFLKSFVSGDPMTFDVKNKTPLQCAPTARLTLAFNNRPRFSDRSSGLWRRMILMPMPVIIPKSEQIKRMDKAEWWKEQGELPGIFLWSLVGLARLKTQGQFTTSEFCENALADYRLESNPARVFLTETCREDPAGHAVSEDLYAAYQRWALKNGYSPLANAKFGGEVRRAFQRVDRRQSGGKWCYFGISADLIGF